MDIASSLLASYSMYNEIVLCNAAQNERDGHNAARSEMVARTGEREQEPERTLTKGAHPAPGRQQEKPVPALLAPNLNRAWEGGSEGRRGGEILHNNTIGFRLIHTSGPSLICGQKDKDKPRARSVVCSVA